MFRSFLPICLVLTLAGCGPPLVWGSDEATKERLLKIVPTGSTVSFLEIEAESRGWRVSYRDDREFEHGLPHYFGDSCEHQGGVSRYVVVAEYGILTTAVETVWLFNEDAELGMMCIRRTTDAL